MQEIHPQPVSDILSGLGPWALAGLWLGLAVLFDLVYRIFVRWRIACEIRRAEAGIPDKWWHRILKTTRGPLSILIWTYGLTLSAAQLAPVAPVDLRNVMEEFFPVIQHLGLVAALLWVLLRATRVLQAALEDYAAASRHKWDVVVGPVVGRSLRTLLPLLALFLVLPLFNLDPETHVGAHQFLSILVIAVISLILVHLVNGLERAVLVQYPLDVRDNLHARKVYTQIYVLKRVAMVVIALIALACSLMVFDTVRQLGTSILASAGIAGIILGFAAQRSLSTLLAGLQIAITQPIRLDDVVIVEGEWGKIEEITLTYVVVRIWDLRRLVLPINYFIETPFQNWTRSSADLLGTVFLHLDFRVPVDEIRTELDTILQDNPKWDGIVKGVQVTDANDRTMEVRILAGSPDSGSAWDLRCEIREKMIAFLQKNYPDSLPRIRAELPRGNGATAKPKTTG